MTFHLFGNILTFYGVAANNRSQTEDNITTLQKIFWRGETHTKISAEAIRWAIRYYWQKAGYPVNRIWKDNPLPDEENPQWQDPSFNPEEYIDDDLLGFMETESPKKEANDQSQSGTSGKNKQVKKPLPKGSIKNRRGALDVTRAVSMTPFVGRATFNSRSGNQKNKTSLYGTEFHGTSYQFGFGITPESCQDKSRVLALLDAIVSIYQVGGNHGRFMFDFAPESIILRWTHDFAPRFLYCFDEDEMGDISVPKLSRQIKSGDLDPKEFWIGGEIIETFRDAEEYVQVNQFSGVKAAVDALKQQITSDLNI
ncbi:MAG: DevR family CRISPR-associated autoregulator [Waterburya sp.]